MLSYAAVAENNAVGRTKFNMLEKMLQPVGPPPSQPATIVLAETPAAGAAGQAGGKQSKKSTDMDAE